jgi:hypothetical protein
MHHRKYPLDSTSFLCVTLRRMAENPYERHVVLREVKF